MWTRSLIFVALVFGASEKILKAEAEKVLNLCEDQCSGLRNDLNQLQTKVQSQEVDIKYIKEGWVVFARYRLLFSLFKMDWLSADVYCKRMGARLASASIRDASSRGKIYNYVRSEGLDYWIGVNDRVSAGVYVWSDSGTLSSGSSLWSPGEPNGSGSTCVRIWNKYYKLDDFSCPVQNRFICEIEL